MDLKSDGINSLLMSISIDSTLKFWDIYQGNLERTIILDYPAEKMELNRENDLLAISKTNNDIEVIIIINKK